jgi:hypothetical protein
LTTRAGFTALISAVVAATSSASRAAVSTVTPVRCFTDSAIASHLDFVRLAKVMCENMSVFIAILWTATEPTPPAPITSTLLIWASPNAE